ncbi:glycoside hydrolase family 2 sugar binding [Caldicellulosiruptor obsidiansis OB47]|uniref:Glycoside hydrolase family 2 sugar binding n=1 Tax=Caldicellulosiruptor obsidiansis (strain ATCC BAA-2073 / JCM 16842 / OB47) TaxID=608506 RepID=D9TG08_CALOO|nr:glycosyl hydrolase [Caldicellulosiruptor obsidiansis]ADL43128.1 glycoside hydrolase family 2 sugar binding [Caldicellulosiruptor obsidiansis OB47]
MNINFKIKPFWFWNGKINNDEIAEQIAQMHEKGIGGFFIHPRQGLEIPYLSHEWFEKVSVAIECAKKYNMEVWLYDEYPYPSGISAGEVIAQHPEYQAFILDYKIVDAKGNEEICIEIPMSEVLLARAYKVRNNAIIWNEYIDLIDNIGIIYKEHIYQESGLTFYNRKRYFVGDNAKVLKWKAPKGEWKIFLFYQYPLKNFKYFGTFIDPLNKDAVKLFIQTTHEKYKKHLGHEFGKTIKGIFTDETAPVSVKLPWSKLLPKLFEQTYGENLIEKLPQIICLDIFDTAGSKIKYQFWKLVVDTFIESYDKQILEWCHQNNLLYVGEKPILRSSQLAFMDIPGIDAGHQKAGDIPQVVSENYRANPKIASSAAHFYKKERVLCECFHSIGWSMTMQDMKWIFDWLILQGIDMFVPHAFYYSADGLKKHDAPPSAFFQMPWWKHQKAMSEYVENIIKMIKNCKRKVDVLVVDPITSQWTCFNDRKVKEKISKDFCRIQQILLEENVDYYVIDQSLVGSLECRNQKIYYDNEKFELLIIPPVTNLEKEAYMKIKDLILKGCKVVFIGCLPFQNIEDFDVAKDISNFLGVNPMDIAKAYTTDSKLNNTVFLNSCIFIGNIEDLATKIDKICKKPVSVSYESSNDRGILCVYFENTEHDFLFIINPTNEKKICKVHLNFNADEINKIYSVPLTSQDSEEEINFENSSEKKQMVFSMDFEPFQSYLIKLEKSCVKKNNHKNNIEKRAFQYKISLEDPWKFSIESLNPLRLGRWNLKLNFNNENEQYSVTSKIPVAPKPIIDQLEEAKIAVPIKTKSFFGCPKEITLPSFEAIYTTPFFVDARDQKFWLVIEDESIKGEWFILLNGYTILPKDFVPKRFYSHTNLAYDISNLIKLGENQLSVCVKISKSFDGLLTPIYIFSMAGVFKLNDSWHIGKLPTQGCFGKDIENGIPFYAGFIKYEKDLQMPSLESGFVEFFIEDNIDRCVSLYINDEFIGTRCWQPYRWKVASDLLSSKKIKFTLEVSTSMLQLFEGEVIEPKMHKIKTI